MMTRPDFLRTVVMAMFAPLISLLPSRAEAEPEVAEPKTPWDEAPRGDVIVDHGPFSTPVYGPFSTPVYMNETFTYADANVSTITFPTESAQWQICLGGSTNNA
jgi:hypothetical protein